MPSQYPPPPSADAIHYPIYTQPAQPQLPELSQQEQLEYQQALTQQPPPLYPKIEPSLADLNSTANNGGGQSGGHPRDHSQDGGAQTPDGRQKTSRLQKACDSCSIRKVKCDNTGPPCKACAALDIPCTRDRPSRRRGPPNRHAEAIKRQRLGEPAVPISPASPTNAAHALAAMSSYGPMSADSICPVEIVDAMINDYFTYSHPLSPYPHEPTFREAWRVRRDTHDRPFLALLAAMLAAHVSSFPRRPRHHFKVHQKEYLFPTYQDLVLKCTHVCNLARGPGFLERDDINIYDAVTSYLLALAYGYMHNWRLSHMYGGESMGIIRALKFYPHDPEGMAASTAVEMDYSQPPPDKITEQIARRLFWNLITGIRSGQQVGLKKASVFVLPTTINNPYPPLPAEVDDTYITASHVGEQPEGVISYMAGFNANCKVFDSYVPLSIVEISYGTGEVFDWERQRRLIAQCIDRCKEVTETMPADLKLELNSSGAQSSGAGADPHLPGEGARQHDGMGGFYGDMTDYDAAMRDPALPTNPYEAEQLAVERRRLQFEVMKANIYASQLITRRFLVDKYFTLREANNKIQAQKAARQATKRAGSEASSTGSEDSPGLAIAGIDTMLQSRSESGPTSNPDVLDDRMASERDQIVKDLLELLRLVNPLHLEPNGHSIVLKVRYIASTLLSDAKERRGPIDPQTEAHLVTFLDALNRLQHAGPTSNSSGSVTGGTMADDDEAGLRAWADLREAQQKYERAMVL